MKTNWPANDRDLRHRGRAAKANGDARAWSARATARVTFQFTDKPLPPQPPAQTGDMASTSAGKPPGKVDASLGAAIQLCGAASIRVISYPPGNPPRSTLKSLFVAFICSRH